jgi:ribosomal-protein-alanine N-acetyltransferase
MSAIGWFIGGTEAAREAAELAAQAFDPEYREAWTEAQMAALLTGPDGWLHGARDAAGMACFALCRKILEDMELLLCAVRPDRRGTGLGKHLLGEVEVEAARRGVRRIFLEVRATNAPALELYKRHGYRKQGRRPDYYRTVSGRSIDAVTLGLELHRPEDGRRASVVHGRLAIPPSA